MNYIKKIIAAKRVKQHIAFMLLFFIFQTSNGQTAIQDLNKTYWQVSYTDSSKLFLELNISEKRFAFKSRNGSSKDILGVKYYLAKSIGKVPSTAVEIKGNCFMKNDTIFVHGTYKSLTSKQSFKGWIKNNRLSATISKNKLIGNRTETYAPLGNYPEVVSKAFNTTENYLFNPELLDSKEWNKFNIKMKKLSHKIMDDYEFKMAYNYNSTKLPFSHYGISVNRPEIKEASTPKKRVKKKVKFNIKRINNETVLFTIKTFSASCEEITPFIDSLKSMAFQNLIVDLRNNQGGSISSALPFARYVVTDTLYGGLFLTQKWFASNKNIPPIESYKDFPIFNEANFDLIIEGIHNENGLCLLVNPDKDNFRGKLYVLTNKNTASACEPLVYSLKMTKRATIVGEKTMGAMLNGEEFNLTKKYNLWMPTADYYAADGYKIDRVGIVPDIKIKPELALEKVEQILRN